MSATAGIVTPGRLGILREELRKLGAFGRRDLLNAWSYRLPFITDWAGLLIQCLLFYFVGLMIDETKLPAYGGTRASYMEFVLVGIALTTFTGIALARIQASFRREQMVGTLESVLVTPTAIATVQLGSVVYDLVYIPLRTAIFFTVVAIAFNLHFELSGILPSLLLLVAFMPFAWGIGIMSAASTLTFKRGAGPIGLGVTLMTVFSGALFPISLLPDWGESIARYNPFGIAIEGMREQLLAGSAPGDMGRTLAILLPVSLATLGASIISFRLALRRERRRGTLGLY